MDNFDLGSVLKEYRKKHHISLMKMGAKLDRSRSAYHNLECGKVKPPYDAVLKILKTFDLDKAIARLQEQLLTRARKEWYNPRYWSVRTKVIVGILAAWSIVPLAIHDFIEGYTRERLEAYPPYKAFVAMAIVFCVFYFSCFPAKTRFFGKMWQRILTFTRMIVRFVKFVRGFRFWPE